MAIFPFSSVGYTEEALHRAVLRTSSDSDKESDSLDVTLQRDSKKRVQGRRSVEQGGQPSPACSHVCLLCPHILLTSVAEAHLCRWLASRHLTQRNKIRRAVSEGLSLPGPVFRVKRCGCLHSSVPSGRPLFPHPEDLPGAPHGARCDSYCLLG